MKLSVITQSPSGKAVFFFVKMTAIFLVLMTAYYFTRERLAPLIIDKLSARPGAWLINTMTPREGVVAVAHIIKSPNAHLEIGKGCDAIDGILLLIGALLASPLPWRYRITGIFVGSGLVYALNITRIVTFYYIIRFRPDWFDFFHNYLFQGILVAAELLFFLAWLRLAKVSLVGTGKT